MTKERKTANSWLVVLLLTVMFTVIPGLLADDVYGASVTVTTDRGTYNQTDSIGVTLSGTYSTDGSCWIGIYEKGETPGVGENQKSAYWFGYITDANPNPYGTQGSRTGLVTAPNGTENCLPPGFYDLVVLQGTTTNADGTYTELGRTTMMIVDAYTVKSANTYTACSSGNITITTNYYHQSGGEWVGLFNTTDTAAYSKDTLVYYGYLSGSSTNTGTITINLTQKGSAEYKAGSTYSLALFEDDSYGNLLTNYAPITISAHGATTSHAKVDATCTATGREAGTTCNVCGGTVSGLGTIPVIEHSYKDATCLAPKTCKKCGATTGSKLSHNYVQTSYTAPTCVNTGSRTLTCQNGCNDTDTETIAALGHTEENHEGVAATCTATGLTAGVYCTTCKTWTTKQEVIAKLDHSYGDWETYKNATCTESGENRRYCTSCETAYESVVVAAKNHSFGDWYVTQTASCTATGTERRDCSNCSHFETRQIAMADHVAGPEATCTSAQICKNCTYQFAPSLGHEQGPAATCESAQTCTRCDYVYQDALGHIAGAEATCTTAQTCTRGCGHVFVEALGHKWVDATCTTPRVCQRCSATEGTALGHDMSAYQERKEATCTSTGVLEHYFCKRCETIYNDDKGTTVLSTITIPKKDHDLIHHEAAAATCTADGNAEYWKCSMCDGYFEDSEGYSKITKDAVVIPAGHKPGAAATCTTDQVCTVCGEVVTKAKGHTEGTAATCTTKQTCMVCGDTLKDALGHTPGEEATCTTAQYCTVCGDTLKQALGHVKGAEATCITDQVCTREGCGVILVYATGHRNIVEATCEDPKTCADCGTEFGVALGHDLSEGTCQEIIVCSRCTYTEEGDHVQGEIICGQPIYCKYCDHKFGDAKESHTLSEVNCNEPTICVDCGTIVAEAVGEHTGGKKACLEDQHCTVCNALMEEARGYHTPGALSCTANQLCTECGELLAEAAGHDWKGATCTTVKKCKICGETEDGLIDHDWIEATCDAPQTCAVCRTTEGEALGHEAGEAATCTADQTCTRCGHVFVEALGHEKGAAATCTADQTCIRCDHVFVEALGHEKGEAATCTTAQTCTRCDYRYNNALGHQAGAEATCMTDQTCRRCDYVYVNALGHQAGAEATCDTAQTCIRCNHVYQAALGHQKGAAATCDAAQTCTRCNHVFAKALGHEKGAAATCTAAQTCTRCDYVYVEAGHTLSPAATCTTAQICTVCGEVKEAAKGHTPTGTATCTTAKTCTTCHAVLAKAKGHKPGAAVLTHATKKVDGKIETKCANCGEIISSEVIFAASKSIMSYTTTVYTGKTIKAPKLTVKDSQGNVLVEGKDYTVSGLTSQKKVGVYKVTITFMGNYTGTKIRYFNVVPKKVSSAAAKLHTAKKNGGYDVVKFSWKASKDATGYLVYYKTSGASKYTLLNSTTKTYYIKGNLKDGVKYNFKVIPYYKKPGGKFTYYAKSQYRVANVYTLKKVPNVKVTKSGTKVKVKWTNINGETGYQISQSTKKGKTGTITTYKTTKGASKKLTAAKGKTYYYKVRAYKVVNGKKVYSPWSTVTKFKR